MSSLPRNHHDTCPRGLFSGCFALVALLASLNALPAADESVPAATSPAANSGAVGDAATGRQAEDLAQFYGFSGLEVFKVDARVLNLRSGDLNGDGFSDVIMIDNFNSCLRMMLQKPTKVPATAPLQPQQTHQGPLPEPTSTTPAPTIDSKNAGCPSIEPSRPSISVTLTAMDASTSPPSALRISSPFDSSPNPLPKAANGLKPGLRGSRTLNSPLQCSVPATSTATPAMTSPSLAKTAHGSSSRDQTAKCWPLSESSIHLSGRD